jgi:hypothetical protein
MKKPEAIVVALFRCITVGGLYGALLGAIYVGLLTVSVAIRTKGADDSIASFCVSLPFGVSLGFVSGCISGLLGGVLGGPTGCSIGGFVGTAVTMPLLFGSGGLPVIVAFGAIPSLWGAAFGFVVGLHIRGRAPLFPGVEGLADCIYGSPLGGWLGWRQRQIR